MIHKTISITANEQTASLSVYALDNFDEFSAGRVRPAVIICPGGGYRFTSKREGEPIAIQMMAAGIQAFVLEYSVAPAEYPTALLQLATAVKTVREHANEWHVDPNRILVAGFSAGGHLAAHLSVEWAKDWISKALHTTKEMIRPNGCILSYPVISSGPFAHQDSFMALLGTQYSDEMLEKVSLEKQVTADMPPVFIWHTFTDETVPTENSLLFVQALREQKISTEFHLYPVGTHGLSLATAETDAGAGYSISPVCTGWVKLATDWIYRL